MSSYWGFATMVLASGEGLLDVASFFSYRYGQEPFSDARGIGGCSRCCRTRVAIGLDALLAMLLPLGLCGVGALLK